MAKNKNVWIIYPMKARDNYKDISGEFCLILFLISLPTSFPQFNRMCKQGQMDSRGSLVL